MGATPKTLSHKERLIRQGMKSFYASGFHGTTVDAILEASGIPRARSITTSGPRMRPVWLCWTVICTSSWMRWPRADDDALTPPTSHRYFTELCETLSGPASSGPAWPASSPPNWPPTPILSRAARQIADRVEFRAVRPAPPRPTARRCTHRSLSRAACAQHPGAYTGRVCPGLSARDTQALDSVCSTFGLLIEPLPMPGGRHPTQDRRSVTSRHQSPKRHAGVHVRSGGCRCLKPAGDAHSARPENAPARPGRARRPRL